jgi:ATPase subunit of ABC transporter with duplicated ATPase domains
LWSIHTEKEALYAKPHMTDAEGTRLGELESEFSEIDGWSVMSLAGEMLEGLSIPTAFHDRPLKELAGSLKVRALLAQALISKPDVLLLDEPTNNLDIDSIRWLENFLNEYEGLILVVSHDRHFLDAICTHVADIDFGTIRLYTGNYSFFTQASQLLLTQSMTDNAKKEKRIEELKAFVARFGANASKARQATSRQKELDKIELEEIRPSSRVMPRILFTANKPLGKEGVVVENASLAFGDKIICDKFYARIAKGEKVAIIGPSGCGKTSLIRMLTGQIAPDSGKVDLGATVELSQVPQDHKGAVPKDTTPLEWLHGLAPKMDTGEIRGLLGRMLFSGEEALKSTSVLSGGETVRLLLAKMMLERSNVLVLDEPTGHLDIESIEGLNISLQNFEGTVIFSTHDRTFIETLATRIFAFTPQGVIDFQGSYEEFLREHAVRA